MPQVWDDDTAAYNQHNIQSINQLLIRPTRLDALDQVVIDAIVAAQDSRGHESQDFFGFTFHRPSL